MKNKIGLIVIILLIVAAYLLNPKFPQHVDKLLPDAINEEIRKSEDMSKLASLGLKYNNYYLFSTTTNLITGDRATFGIFGVVFR